jgi:hypothetical protein
MEGGYAQNPEAHTSAPDQHSSATAQHFACKQSQKILQSLPPFALE